MLLDCDMKITDQSKLCCSISMEIKEDRKESRVERTFCIIYFDRRGGRRRGGQRQKRRSIKFVDHLPSACVPVL